MYNNGHEYDGYKHWILADTSEYVEFSLFKKSGIKLIENLHEYESIEYYRE